MKTLLLLGILGGFFILDSAAQADIEYWKVVQVTGVAQMKSPAQPDWKNLSAPFYLRKGSLVRTGKDAIVDFCLNRQWSNFLQLNENSELEFPKESPKEVRLKKGSLFALLEAESGSDSLHIFSPDVELRVGLGGLAVFASASRSTLKVFSESVEVVDLKSQPSDSPKIISEGWEWSAGQTRRLDFSDYAEWQRWFRKSYERKDKFFLKRSL